MKKYAIIFLIFMLAVSMTGCFYYHEVDRTYELLYDASHIETVNIYLSTDMYGNPPDEPNWQLDPEYFEAFTNDLESLHFTEGYLFAIGALDPSFHLGDYTVEIIYDNGGYDMISNRGYQEYCDENGKSRGRHYSCETEVWNGFVEHYLSFSISLT